MGYAEKIFGLSEQVRGVVSDRRPAPRIPTSVFTKAGLVMFWVRLGSLNALVESAGSRFWKKWLGTEMPSADSVGRVYAQVDRETLRQGLRHIYTRLKRNKALETIAGLTVAVLDGHETHASYRRHCAGCLERIVHTVAGDRIQYYHRNVTVMLLAGRLRFLLDLEPQRRGEDEVATGIRLLERVLADYPRAFQRLLADAFYCKAPFVNFLWSHHKYILVVLKDERRDLYDDVLGLCKIHRPQEGRYRKRKCLWWDVPDLTTWPQVTSPMRVVRSQETWSVKRQATQEWTSESSAWMWVTNLPPSLASTEQVVQLGHARWDIENYGFNELVNGWHADHVYKHDPDAIEALYLMVFIAFNLFHAFLARNLKPPCRQGKSERFWIRIFISEIYSPGLKNKHTRAP